PRAALALLLVLQPAALGQLLPDPALGAGPGGLRLVLAGARGLEAVARRRARGAHAADAPHVRAAARGPRAALRAAAPRLGATALARAAAAADLRGLVLALRRSPPRAPGSRRAPPRAGRRGELDLPALRRPLLQRARSRLLLRGGLAGSRRAAALGGHDRVGHGRRDRLAGAGRGGAPGAAAARRGAGAAGRARPRGAGRDDAGPAASDARRRAHRRRAALPQRHLVLPVRARVAGLQRHPAHGLATRA